MITGRTQNVGVADHDAVVYDIAVLDKPSAVWRLPAGEHLLEAPIPEDMWENAWQQVDNDFQKCLTEGEIQQAWVILSNCAERLMHPKAKASRAERSGPQQMASPPSSKAPTFQTLFERKLRRFARRVQEFQRSFLPELARKLHRDARQLHPSLAEFGLGDRSLAVAALRLADKEAAQASSRRVAAWREEVQENVAKLSGCSKRPPCHRVLLSSMILSYLRKKQLVKPRLGVGTGIRRLFLTLQKYPTCV